VVDREQKIAQLETLAAATSPGTGTGTGTSPDTDTSNPRMTPTPLRDLSSCTLSTTPGAGAGPGQSEEGSLEKHLEQMRRLELQMESDLTILGTCCAATCGYRSVYVRMCLHSHITCVPVAVEHCAAAARDGISPSFI